MSQQERYWRELDQLKVHIQYLDIYLEKTFVRDRNINIFLAIMSSASIGGWVVWQHYAFVWALLIAISQVINAVKIYLPYSKRLKSLRGITLDLESLFLAMERSWYDVAEGKLTNDQINQLTHDYKDKIHGLVKKHLSSIILPENTKWRSQAKEITKEYFKNSYQVEG